MTTMQPREPQWDRPLVTIGVLAGCGLIVVLAAGGGALWWMMRDGWRPPSPFTSAEPAPSAEAAPTATVAVDEEPAPAPTANEVEALREKIQRDVDREARRMKERLERDRESVFREGKVDGAWAPAPSNGEAPLDIRRVGGGVEPPKVISRVQPVYPEPARLARVQGIVIVEAVIDEHGDVRRVRVLKGLPMGLDTAAVDAVRRWKFAPATFEGRPVAVYFILTVNFKVE